MNLLYIIDRTTLDRIDCTITGDSYYSRYGRIILNKTNKLLLNKETSNIWFKYIYCNKGLVSLITSPSNDELCEAEELIIKEVYERFRNMNHNDITSFIIEDFYECRHTSHISIEDILIALNKTNIDEIINKINNNYIFDRLLNNT